MCSPSIAPRQKCAELQSQSLGEGGGSGGLEKGLEVNATSRPEDFDHRTPAFAPPSLSSSLLFSPASLYTHTHSLSHMYTTQRIFFTPFFSFQHTQAQQCLLHQRMMLKIA